MESEPWYAKCVTSLSFAARSAPKVQKRSAKTSNSCCAASARQNWILLFSICVITLLSPPFFSSHPALKRHRACQKEDWREHKKFCGKQISKKLLLGTTRDSFWKYPTVPDYARNFPVDAAGNIHITSVGFGTAHPSRPHSPALQRQLSLLTGDKYADYFLFDELDRPVRFMIWDMCTKIPFRNLRSEALSSPKPKGLVAVAEYLVKMMSHQSGEDSGTAEPRVRRGYWWDASEVGRVGCETRPSSRHYIYRGDWKAFDEHCAGDDELVGKMKRLRVTISDIA